MILFYFLKKEINRLHLAVGEPFANFYSQLIME